MNTRVRLDYNQGEQHQLWKHNISFCYLVYSLSPFLVLLLMLSLSLSISASTRSWRLQPWNIQSMVWSDIYAKLRNIMNYINRLALLGVSLRSVDFP